MGATGHGAGAAGEHEGSGVVVAAMVEPMPSAAATVVLDYYCPVCKTGYLGWVRLAGGHVPTAGLITKSGHCSRCRKWREVDLAAGVPRTRPIIVT